MLFKRRILCPWLLSAVVMFGLSYVWHGLALTDLDELRIPLAGYLALSGLAYLVIGLGITFAVHQAILHEWISLKRAFPLTSMLVGMVIGFIVYLLAYVFGMSFTDRGVTHVVADAVWQMVEQGIGGLMVSLGLIYDMHRTFMEAEKAQ